MKPDSEAFRWEAHEPRPDAEPPQHALGAWVHAGTGRRLNVERGSEAFRWEASEPKPDAEPPQHVLGAWVRTGAGR